MRRKVTITEDFAAFGPDWIRRMTRFRKAELLDFLRDALISAKNERRRALPGASWWRMPNNELPRPDDHVLLMIERETSGLWYVAGGYCREGARKKDGHYFTTTDGRMPFGRVVGWTPMGDAVNALGLATQPARRREEAMTAKETVRRIRDIISECMDNELVLMDELLAEAEGWKMRRMELEEEGED